MNSKKSLLLLSFIFVQSAYPALAMLNKYSNQILLAGSFALAEYGISRLKKPEASISSIKIDPEFEKNISSNPITNKNPIVSKFLYLILEYKKLPKKDQQTISKNLTYQVCFLPSQALSFFSFHKLFLGKHKNYTRSFNQVATLYKTVYSDSDTAFQNRLKLFSLLYLPNMYCNLENSPLFFADSNLHWTISTLFSHIFNQQLVSTSNAMNNESYIKKLINSEFDQILPQYQLALMQSFAFCRACGILKNPFPNAYHLLPKNITHYAHQTNLKGKIALLGIDLCQKIGYLFFIRYILFNALAIINDYTAQPIADFCIKKPANENQENIKKMLCLFTSGIIILFCCDKMLHVLYQHFNIRP